VETDVDSDAETYRAIEIDTRTKIRKNSYHDPSDHPPSQPINETPLNSYSLLSNPLEIGPELTMDYLTITTIPLISAREYAGALVRLAFE